EGARRLEGVDERRFRQAEMEARHLRLELDENLAGLGVERRAGRRAHGRVGIEAELAVIAGETVAPCRFARVVRAGRPVTEEIDVDRPLRAGADFFDLLT